MDRVSILTQAAQPAGFAAVDNGYIANAPAREEIVQGLQLSQNLLLVCRGGVAECADGTAERQHLLDAKDLALNRHAPLGTLF